jgi:hypothetical protein
MTSSR